MEIWMATQMANRGEEEYMMEIWMVNTDEY